MSLENGSRSGASSLQGRFVPLIPSIEQEMALDRPDAGNEEEMDEYGLVSDGLPKREPEFSSEKRSWSTKSQAAKRRWANPEYRQKILEKRRAKVASKKSNVTPRVQIGTMDSVALSTDEKAAEIIRYCRSNQLRSEAMRRFRRDPLGWMNEKLQSGQEHRERKNSAEHKLQQKQKRSESAKLRHQRRAASELEESTDT
eukprot:CAMPEP_0182442482 /NCGR_PEP_ID=MMETSP1172-20130603/1390_1 /TAXON_ID=708627 /ORGANISM="Timspurckia oligopyrenoides, Strain CCMP3278" /LENGTH=198 /DNA_ID=CAMNT_0024637359 /DNA_START=204 /DNA_END=800 /DNA_ORIENTATION=-